MVFFVLVASCLFSVSASAVDFTNYEPFSDSVNVYYNYVINIAPDVSSSSNGYYVLSSINVPYSNDYFYQFGVVLKSPVKNSSISLSSSGLRYENTSALASNIDVYCYDINGTRLSVANVNFGTTTVIPDGTFIIAFSFNTSVDGHIYYYSSFLRMTGDYAEVSGIGDGVWTVSQVQTVMDVMGGTYPLTYYDADGVLHTVNTYSGLDAFLKAWSQADLSASFVIERKIINLQTSVDNLDDDISSLSDLMISSFNYSNNLQQVYSGQIIDTINSAMGATSTDIVTAIDGAQDRNEGYWNTAGDEAGSTIQDASDDVGSSITEINTVESDLMEDFQVNFDSVGFENFTLPEWVLTAQTFVSQSFQNLFVALDHGQIIYTFSLMVGLATVILRIGPAALGRHRRDD